MAFLKDNLWKVFTFTLILGISLSRTIAIAEPDSFWQIKSGQDFLKHSQFLASDTYSWSAFGAEYLSNSWLWNALLGWIYNVASFEGVSVLVGVYVGLTLVLSALYLRSRNIGWGSIFIGVSVISILLGKWFTSRPQVNDYLLLVLGLLVIQKLSQKSMISLFVVLGFIILLWNNLHLTGPVGALCFGGMYFLALYNGDVSLWGKETFSAIIRSVALIIFLLGLCFITPYGMSGITKSFETASASAGLISEWISPWDLSENSNFSSAVALLVIFLPLVLRVKEKRWVEAVFLLGIFAVGSYQARWVPFVLLMALPYICGDLEKARIFGVHQFMPYIKVTALSVVLATLTMGVTTFFAEDRVSRGGYGYAILDEVPQGCKLYNDVSFGGPMILMRPDVKVSMDGRNDLYGREEYLEQAYLTYAIEGTDRWLEDNGITCVLIHSYQGLDTYLSHQNTWEMRAEDSHGARLWVKK
ncbi:MAG: hypothetical protein H9W81_12700 [Enterococcus sp.]|nr:hypothetical protein [Enterococcus sp.]